MAGLQRFITYIYRYENNAKKENAGFAKIEIRGTICRMEVHIRNINLKQLETTVYLFTRKADIMQGILVGNIAVSRGNGDIRYAFETKELLDFGITIGELEGIFIPFGEDVCLASQWKEGEIVQKRFRIMEKQKRPETDAHTVAEDRTEGSRGTASAGRSETTKSTVTADRAEGNHGTVTSGRSETTKATVAEEGEQEDRIETTADAAAPADKKLTTAQMQKESGKQKRTIQATELPVEEFFEESGWEGIFQKLRLKLNVIFPFEGQEIECVRMQLNDLQELPKKYWYIGNNSFLLHGFFNYRHIIFGEMEEDGKKEYFIGVPGVFANQERIMASMFGFPEFRTAQNTEYKTGNFGYWYRII